MTVKILIPIPLRKICDDQTEVVLDLKKNPTTYDKVLEALIHHYPEARERLYLNGDLNRFVNHYIDQEDIRNLNGLESAVKDGAELSIVPAIAGGVYYHI